MACHCWLTCYTVVQVVSLCLDREWACGDKFSEWIMCDIEWYMLVIARRDHDHGSWFNDPGFTRLGHICLQTKETAPHKKKTWCHGCDINNEYQTQNVSTRYFCWLSGHICRSQLDKGDLWPSHLPEPARSSWLQLKWMGHGPNIHRDCC